MAAGAATVAGPMRLAVVGHTEWIDFLRVRRVPDAGEIVHAVDSWQEPGGGGAVAAVQCARLAGETTFYTAVGGDDYAPRTIAALTAMGVRVEAATREAPSRRAVTFVDDAGERTIAVMGELLGPAGSDALPWAEIEQADAVYFTAGDALALHHARRAGILVATPRAMSVLRDGGVLVDVLVGSDADGDERYDPGDLDPPPRIVVRTRGAAGGSYSVDGGEPQTFPAAPLPGPVLDAYGCGDSFTGGLMVGLAQGLSIEQAVELAARCGAACLTGRGPYEGQLDLRKE